MLPTVHVHAYGVVVERADDILLISFNQLISIMEMHYFLCCRNWHFFLHDCQASNSEYSEHGTTLFDFEGPEIIYFWFSLCHRYCKSFLSGIRAQNVLMLKVLVKLFYT